MFYPHNPFEFMVIVVALGGSALAAICGLLYYLRDCFRG